MIYFLDPKFVYNLFTTFEFIHSWLCDFQPCLPIFRASPPRPAGLTVLLELSLQCFWDISTRAAPLDIFQVYAPSLLLQLFAVFIRWMHHSKKSFSFTHRSVIFLENKLCCCNTCYLKTDLESLNFAQHLLYSVKAVTIRKNSKLDQRI